MGRLRTSLKNSVWLAAFLGVMQAATLPGANWTLIDLGTLGGSQTFADSINDLGQVVGSSQLAGDGGSHAFFYANGVMQDISPINSGDIRAGRLGINNFGHVASGVVVGDSYYPAIYHPQGAQTMTLGSLGCMSGFTGVATGINDSGVTVGYSYLSLSGPRHAFIYRNGSMADLGSLGGYSGALGVNASGVAVGFASDTMNGFGRAVVWANHSILDISNGSESEARAINDFGQVVGEATSPTGTHQAFLWNNGTTENLGTLATGRNSEAYSINNHGDVVGSSDVISGISFETNPITREITIVTNYQSHAFLYSNGSMTDLNTLISTNSGWQLYYAYGINNSDQIVGWGSMDGGENFRSFILQIPEPSAPVLLCSASACMLVFSRLHWRARRRRKQMSEQHS
jgi:probable HAF family extracellular repeat protein